MAGSDHGGSILFGNLHEGVEFDFSVAEHVGIWGTALGILVEHIVDNPLPVLFRQVDKIKGNPYFSRYQFCDKAVFFPFAVPVEGGISVVPILHEHGKNIVSLLF